MAVIPVSIKTLIQFYPRRPDLKPELKKFMDALKKAAAEANPPQPVPTPCCVQMSHALNLAGQTIPQKMANQRRNNSGISTGGTVYYYLLAVDELENWLTQKYPGPELISRDQMTGKARTPQQIQGYLQGRFGIVVFRDSGPGFHTELWDGKHIVQGDIDSNAVFGKQRVLFWDTNDPAQWLTDYMSKQP